jgi:hypothetical protein
MHLRLGNREGTAVQLCRLGEVLAEQGKPSAALDWLERSIALLRRLGAAHYLSEALAAKAGVMFGRGEAAEAEALLGEASRIAAELGLRPNIEARILEVRLAMSTGRAGAGEGAAKLQAMAEAGPAWERAAALYALWQLDPQEQAPAGAAAARLYAELYAVTHDPRDRERHTELAGEGLAARAMPELPEGTADEAAPLESLLAQADEALAAWLSQQSE